MQIKPVLASAIIFSLSRSCLLLDLPSALAQNAEARLHQALLDATSGFTLMAVGAHPDDEDIEAVTYYRQKYGARVVVVIASRGEGGQNEIGPELYSDLAVIRSREMREAERISGGEYFNLNFVDFGFSKPIAETYERWGQQEIERRLVYLIRELRPHVIITNHDSTSGHSNHKAVGAELLRAFQAAGNADAFPEQIAQGLKPWKPLRLYWRVSDNQAAAVALQVGERHPYDSRTYARIAAEALSQHRSQGMDLFAKFIPDGPRQRRYQLVMTAVNSPPLKSRDDLFSGMKAPWRLELGGPAQKWLKNLAGLRHKHAPILNLRHAAYQALLNLPANGGLSSWQRQRLQELFAITLGLDWDLSIPRQHLVPSEQVAATWNFALEPSVTSANGDSMSAIRLIEKALYIGGELAPFEQGTNGNVAILPMKQTERVQVPTNAAMTFPRQKTVYSHFRQPEPVWSRCTFQWNQVRFDLQHAIEAEVEIVPQVQIEMARLPVIVNLAQTLSEICVPFMARNNSNDAVAAELVLLQGDQVVAKKPVDLQAGAVFNDCISFAAPALRSGESIHLSSRLDLSGVNSANSDRSHRIFPDSVKIVADSFQIPEGLEVGLISSYDTTLVWAMNQLKIQFAEISDAELVQGEFEKFDTIVIDMRAYLVREALRRHNQKLLPWVNQGGHLVVMYHKTGDWNLPTDSFSDQEISEADLKKETFAPYPLVLGSSRVTMETAPMNFQHRDHPIFHFPHEISEELWNDWVQERGLYFPRTWDDRYVSLVETADSGEAPLPGSMLFAEYGDGTYLYTSLVWYRQLRAGLVEVFKMLVNMLARS